MDSIAYYTDAMALRAWCRSVEPATSWQEIALLNARVALEEATK